MPAPIFTTILDPAALLERAVEGLLPLAAPSEVRPWPTLDSWIVLRQGGLRDDLHRLVARRGVAGWFDPPICLFDELGARWGAESGADAPALTEPERHALLAALVEANGAGLFGTSAAVDAWVPAVDRLIGELIAEGIAPEDFARALDGAARAANVDDAIGAERSDVLSRLYAAWHEALARSGRCDGRDAKVRLAAFIRADPDAFAARLGGRREIRIVGLADLRGGWRALLDALADMPALDRLEILTSVDAVGVGFAAALFTDATPASAAGVRLLEAPDAARELELVAVRVRRLIDSGVPPTSIAVVAREARPAVDEMATMLARVGVPVTARRRTALGHTTSGRAVAAILRAAGEQWSRHSIAELAEHPLLRTGLDAGVVNHVGYTRAITELAEWGDGLRELLARCEARERDTGEPDEHREALPTTARVRATLAAWETLQPRLALLEQPRTLASWCAWVGETLDPADDASSWGIGAALQAPCADADVWRNDVRARDAIVAVVTAWRDALSAFHTNGAPMDAARFRERFALMLEQDLVTPPESDFGVVVAEALAAGWRSFEHVFVVGLAAGAFPRRPSPGPLFDVAERRALSAAGLALDPVDAWRARERELFRVVCAGARESLTLSWPAMDAEAREVARSAYVDEAAAVLARAHGLVEASGEEQDLALEALGILERVPTHETLVPGFPLMADAGALAHARAAALRERGRTLDLTPFNGEITDPALLTVLAERCGPDFVWSATQLEEAAKCRWHWFADRLLGLEERGDADDLMEPTVRGSILHDALDRFFAAATREIGAPVFLRETHVLQAAALMSAALGEAWTEAEKQGEWLGPVVIRPTIRRELELDLQKYLAWEIGYNEKSYDNRTNASKEVRMGAVEGEFRFSRVPLEGDGRPFLLRGSVDRIDRGVDERVAGAERYIAAIDYKSSKYATPAAGKKEAWRDGIVLQVPLYAAALRQLRPESAVARMEYRTLRRPEVVHKLSLAPLKQGELQDPRAAEEQLAAALDAAGRKIGQLRRGELPAEPTESAGCSKYCPARDICRIPGGPVDVDR